MILYMQVRPEPNFESDLPDPTPRNRWEPGDLITVRTFVSCTIEQQFDDGSELWKFESPFFSVLLDIGIKVAANMTLIAYHGETLP